MKHTEGDRNFTAPPLKSAPVFGGIAGIMTAEQGDLDDDGNVPSMSSKAQESGKLQDMYRRNLAASWAAQAGELPADKCIEDIFAGGDGWGNHDAGTDSSPRTRNYSSEDDSDGDRRTLHPHQRKASSSTLKKSHGRPSSKGNPGASGVSGRASIEQQVQSSNDSKRHSHRHTNEVDEFTARDDLRSWEISANG